MVSLYQKCLESAGQTDKTLKSTQWLFYLQGGRQRRAGCTIVWAVQRVFREQVVLCIHGDRCGEYGHQVLRWNMMTEPTNGSNCTPSGIILHPSPAKKKRRVKCCFSDEDFNDHCINHSVLAHCSRRTNK